MMNSSKWQVPFFTVWIGQAFSMVGSAVVRFALIWWLTEQTGSATTLSLASVVSMLPFVILGPFVGVLVDRWNRKWVMIVSDSLIALLTAFLAYLYWIDRMQIWHVYAVLFLRSLGGTFQDPAMRASTSLMVPKEQLTRVGGMNETLQGVVNIVSPPLGAMLLKVLDMQGTLAIDIVTAVLAVLPLFFIHIPQLEALGAKKEKGDRRMPIVQDVVQGFRYLWGWQGLFFLLVVLSVMRFFTTPTFSMLPLVVTQHFGGEALELGWLNSAHGFGFVAGGFILSLWGGFRRKTFTALLGLVGMGIGNLIFGLVPGDAFGLALVVMFARTMMIPMIRGSVLSIFQVHVPPEIQGRVFTMLISVVSIMAPIGVAIGGPVADAIGVKNLFVVSGVGCLVLAVLWAMTPKILYLEDEMRP
jgi:DHA3 family macrolide efflux protein-like MFS transporter